MKPHKHAEVIKAYADGAVIQINSINGWEDLYNPAFYPMYEYRIKPRIFEEDAYYPAILECGGDKVVAYYDGEFFHIHQAGEYILPHSFKWIGEKLDITFPTL